MPIIELEQALSEIKQACEDFAEKPHESPFFLVTGAGVSFPPVPLAADIIGHCKETAEKYQRKSAEGIGSVLDEYSNWFSLAYPQPRLRQRYLRNLIENRPVSLANLRLAHLLAARVLTNLVVTTNFDDYLARALRLFGQSPVVCDHPRTVARIDADADELQIVHAHGSYLFYDCANLTGEVTVRAEFDRDSSLTILGLLDTILWRRSPILVGYSGWEGDVVMSALKRRLGGGHPLGHAIYWFCFNHETTAKFPDWIKKHPDVRLVSPPERPGSAPPGLPAAEGSTRLPAQHVFEEFIKVFNAREPELFRNPFDYFARQLESALPTDPDGGEGRDPYSFRALIERIRHAERPSTGRSREATKADQQTLDNLRKAIRESEFRKAWMDSRKLMPRLERLSAAEQKEVRDGSWLAGEGLVNRPPVEKELIPALVETLSEDAEIESIAGDLPPHFVILAPCRTRQFAMEFSKDGAIYGAFNYHLSNSLAEKASDKNGDGLISMHDALLSASEKMLTASQPQTPVFIGDRQVALFSTKVQTRSSGTLHALLIGINDYRMNSMNLNGCINDVNLLTKVLEGDVAKKRALFKKVAITTLENQKATSAAILRGIAGLCRRALAQDILLVGFYGHGFLADKSNSDLALSLVAHDYEGGNTGIVPRTEIMAHMKKSKARAKILILDIG